MSDFRPLFYFYVVAIGTSIVLMLWLARARAIAIIPIIRGGWDYAPKARDYATLHKLYRDYRDYAVGIT